MRWRELGEASEHSVQLFPLGQVTLMTRQTGKQLLGALLVRSYITDFSKKQQQKNKTKSASSGVELEKIHHEERQGDHGDLCVSAFATVNL